MQRFPFIIILCFLLSSCSKQLVVDHTNTQVYALGKSDYTSTDTSIVNFTEPYKKQMDAQMDEVIGSNAQTMEKDKPESSLGNFMADACLIEGKKNYTPQNSIPIDFCFLNYGGIRVQAVAKGEITLGKVYEMMPFENELVVLTLDGTSIDSLLIYFGIKGDNPVSGISYKIKDQKLKDVVINQNPFDHTHIYKVLTSEYLANGGDNLLFLTSAIKKEYVNLKVRDALINYIRSQTQEGKKIESKKDGRVSYEQ